MSTPPPLPPDRHRTAMLLALAVGVFGVHRLYLGRYATGLVMLIGTVAWCIAGWMAAAQVQSLLWRLVVILVALLTHTLLIGTWSMVDLWLLARQPTGHPAVLGATTSTHRVSGDVTGAETVGATNGEGSGSAEQRDR